MANFHTPYEIERDGQMEFFDNYGIPYDNDESILVDNTDGVYNGNIFEFKRTINNLNQVLFQAIKYLSRMRVKGESVPATILLIDLNATTVYVYKSKDYFDAIHTIYAGAASKDNAGFVAGKYDMKLNYSDMLQSASVKKILKEPKRNPYEMYMPINIDENCIVGWAERYYREKPKASKGDFLGDDTGTAVRVKGEIRDPRHFKGLINPYTGKSNEKFKYLMDCLNDRLSKKDLGAFYTPMPYAKKAAELVQMAVERVPEGNDYIILDRCAGTGNLEVALIGLTDRDGSKLIEHCVVSTYEYYEYKVLIERIGDQVRDIIPPSEANVVYESGKVANADAMSKDFIDNPIIKQYVDNPNCTIILLENPPYRDGVADNNTRKNVTAQRDYIFATMKSSLATLPNSNISTIRDLTNRFIWSGFRFYLRQESDAYILFSPIKYWKSLGLANYECVNGYLFNRAHFHASPSAISCIFWTNKKADIEKISLEAMDIIDEQRVDIMNIVIAKAHKTLEPFFDRRKSKSDVVSNVYCEANGEETNGRKCDGTSYAGPDIIGYQRTDSFGVDPKHVALTRCTLFNIRGYYLRRDAYLNMLPLFCAKQFPQDYWYERDVYFTTSDGGNAYKHDDCFLKSCLIFACLSIQNKCLSFDALDGCRYQNELCFDDSKLSFGIESAANVLPLALKDLNRYAASKSTTLDEAERKLIAIWERVLAEARKTKGYNPEFNYGVYQISKELNTSHTVGTGKSKKTVYDYPALNGHLDTLRVMLKAYYMSHIKDKMFQYELLK